MTEAFAVLKISGSRLATGSHCLISASLRTSVMTKRAVLADPEPSAVVPVRVQARCTTSTDQPDTVRQQSAMTAYRRRSAH